MKIAPWVLMASLALPLQIAAARPQQGAPTTGQQQEDPLAAAAQKAREQKKNEGKPPKVWNNDNIPTGTINIVGSAPTTVATADNVNPQAPAQGKTAPEAPAANSPELSKAEQAALQADLDSAKQQMESLKTDLDIAQRKFVLDEKSYYGITDYASDKAGATALDDERAQIEAKQQALAAAQKQLEELQATLAAAASSPGPSSSTPSNNSGPSKQDSK